MKTPSNSTSLLSILLGLTTVILVGLVIFLLTKPSESPLSQALHTVGMEMQLDGPVELLRAEAEEGRMTTVFAGIADDRLKIRVFEGHTPESAAALKEDMHAQFRNLFGDRQAPYPGQLSKTLSCPETFLPKELETSGDQLLVMQLFANARFSYGGCDESLLRYRSTMGLIYMRESGRFFQVEYFEPVDPTASDQLNAPLKGPKVLEAFRSVEGGR